MLMRAPVAACASPCSSISAPFISNAIATSTMPSAMPWRELALAGFQRDGGGDGAGLAVDVPADHQRAADFRDHAAEAGQHRRHHAEAHFVQHGHITRQRDAPSAIAVSA